MKSFLLSSLIFMGTLNAQVLIVQPPPPPPQGVPAIPAVPPPNVGGPNTNPIPPHTPPPPPQVSAAQVISQPPPATPQYGPPVQQTPYNAYNPYQYMGQMDPQNLNCEMGQCRNRRISLSPGQGFQLNCNQARQCDGLDLTLNVGFDPTNPGSNVNEINDLNFDAPQNGVTVRINGMAGNNIEVNNIKCSVMFACQNLRFIAGWGVETHNINVHCEQPGACNGCTINNQPCVMYAMANGNNNGYMPYGYGYTNTANVPQQPVGGPQLPQQTYSGQPLPQYQPYPQWI